MINEEEDYLRKNGWIKADDELWKHNLTRYLCCQEVAVEVQKLRDKNK